MLILSKSYIESLYESKQFEGGKKAHSEKEIPSRKTCKF